MVDGLGSDDDVVLVAPDLAPDSGLDADRLRKTSEVDELALLVDLGKGGTIGLCNHNKLAAVTAYPPPGRRPLTGGAAEVGVGDEVVEVDLVTFVNLRGSPDRGCVKIIEDNSHPCT